MRRTGDRGIVTAEAALALPTLVLVTAVLLWGISAASIHLACADAARAGVRAAARGEPLPEVRSVVARAVPAGATINVQRNTETAHVEITIQVPAPAAANLPPLTIRTQATTATEPGAHPTP